MRLGFTARLYTDIYHIKKYRYKISLYGLDELLLKLNILCLIYFKRTRELNCVYIYGTQARGAHKTLPKIYTLAYNSHIFLAKMSSHKHVQIVNENERKSKVAHC